MRRTFTLAFLQVCVVALGQQTPADSTRLLQEIVIEAYETHRRLDEVPASIGFLDSNELQRFSNTSILPAVNVVPGVRMEERSPGSYRFSIRGSSLRSPFGVRNVKVYWNGLPFTDGGGNTYLNLLDFSSIGTLEVIKGPGGSLYGAGTGGVLLLKSPDVTGTRLNGSAVFGSYGLQRYLLGGQFRRENVTADIRLAHHKSDGYREQTALKRNALNTNLRFRIGNKGTLSSTLIFSNLYYGTPGGLTKAQYESDPRQARPPSPVALGAVQANARVRNETTFGGFVYDHDWNNQWYTTTGVYGGYSDYQNSSIRNYEYRWETNMGLRSHTVYRIYQNQASVGGKITFGGEYQYFVSPIAIYDNDGAGNPAGLQVKDKVTSRMGLIFAQGDIALPEDLYVTAGASVNFLTYHYRVLDPPPHIEQTRNFDAVFSPRVGVLKKFSDNISVHASYSDGFSPPTLAEVRPSTNTFSNTLKAESGNNLEFGARGSFLDRKLSYDVVVYDFRLRNTIVLQRNAEGADYFINAGKTSQRGAEALVAYEISDDERWLSRFRLWGSYAYQHYRFKEYLVVDEDFSGNALTGIAPTIFSAGLDGGFAKQFTANVTVNYVDHIPLNDANTAFAPSYVLVGLRGGWNTMLEQSHRLEIFAGIDNALDEAYSLGNDLNAFGGRYYNAAMPRNYYAGVSITLDSGK